jgi:hypothetical protein
MTERLWLSRSVSHSYGAYKIEGLGQHPAGHHRMQVKMGCQVLRPDVQHQAEGRRAVGAAHPLAANWPRVCAVQANKVIDDPSRMGAVQAIETVRQGEHQIRVRHGQHLGQASLARAALRAPAVAPRVVLPVAVRASITGEQLAAQYRCAASHVGPQGFGLRSAQEVIGQMISHISLTKLAQRIGQGGAHGAPDSVTGVRHGCLGFARQLRQQCQRGIVGAPARAGHVQVAPGRSQLGVAHQLADAVRSLASRVEALGFASYFRAPC